MKATCFFSKLIVTVPPLSLHQSPLPAGKKNKLRVYYLSWLRNKILHNDPEVEKKQGWVNVGDLEGCVHYKVGTFPEQTKRGMNMTRICCKQYYHSRMTHF